MNDPIGAPVAGFGVAIFFSAAPKIASQPPNFAGSTMIATTMTM